MRWNCRSKALRSLQITAKNQDDFPVLTVFLIIETSFQNISITLLRFCLIHEHRGDRIGEKSSCERFCKVPVPGIIAEVLVMGGKSHFVAMTTSMSLQPWWGQIFILIQLWSQFFQIFVYGDVVYAQTRYARTAYVVAIWVLTLISFRLFRKNLGKLRDFFGQMVYRTPWQKNSRAPMRNDHF